MFEYKKISENVTENGIYSIYYETKDNINIVNFIKYLQSIGYVIQMVGIGNNSDMYERTLMPTYGIEAYEKCYNSIITSPEYTRTQINVVYNGEKVVIYVKDNKIGVVSYDTPISLEDIIKDDNSLSIKKQ